MAFDLKLIRNFRRKFPNLEDKTIFHRSEGGIVDVSLSDTTATLRIQYIKELDIWILIPIKERHL